MFPLDLGRCFCTLSFLSFIFLVGWCILWKQFEIQCGFSFLHQILQTIGAQLCRATPLVGITQIVKLYKQWKTRKQASENMLASLANNTSEASHVLWNEVILVSRYSSFLMMAKCFQVAGPDSGIVCIAWELEIVSNR